MATLLSFRKNTYQRLLDFAARGPVHRHLAYNAAGWLTLLGVTPPARQAPQSRPQIVLLLLGAFIVLVFALAFLGAAAATLQPVLRAIGGLTLERAMLACLLWFLAWRHSQGRKCLRPFLTQGDSSCTS